MCPKIWHLSHKLQPLKCADKLVLPEDIQGQAGASEWEPLCSWGRVRRGRGRLRPSSSCSLSRWSWARPHCSASLRSTGRWLLQMLCSYRGRNNPAQCCRPSWHTHTLQSCRQTNNYPELPFANSSHWGWARGGANQRKCKCFYENDVNVETRKPFLSQETMIVKFLHDKKCENVKLGLELR